MLILGASLSGPVLLSFDKRVAFYKKWKYAFAASLLPALFYVLWDIRFTMDGVWEFNDAYIIGQKIGGLPVEEVLFFFAVPFCCTFIYECIRSWFPRITGTVTSDRIFFLTGLLMFAAAIVFQEKAYTFYTTSFVAAFIFLFFALRKKLLWFNTKLFLISYLVILIPFLIVNGFLTSIPVVIYNDAENLALRLYSIPVEDVFYGMLLVFLNLVIYERLIHRQRVNMD